MTKREQRAEMVLICVVIIGLAYWLISLKLGESLFIVVDHWLVLFGVFVAGGLAMLNRHRPVQAYLILGALLAVLILWGAWLRGNHGWWPNGPAVALLGATLLTLLLSFFLRNGDEETKDQ